MSEAKRPFALPRRQPITPEIRADREAQALEMLRAGETRKRIQAATRIYNADLTAFARQHGFPGLTNGCSNRLTDAERARREALALDMLHDGRPRTLVAERVRLSSSAIARLAEAHGIPQLPRGPRPRGPQETPCDHITRMSFEELDALEARVAADRAAGRLPPLEPEAPALDAAPSSGSD